MRLNNAKTDELSKKADTELKQLQRRYRYRGMKSRPKNVAKRKADKGYKIKITTETLIWFRPQSPIVRKETVVRSRIYLKG